MKKINSLKIVSAVTVLMVFCAVEMILLHDNAFFSWSISSLIYKAQYYTLKTHLLVLALLPIYIGVVIFGSATLGIYIGTMLEQLLGKLHRKQSTASDKDIRRK